MKDLESRIMQLIADNEGGWSAVSGNFDGQLLSFGPLQWNAGQGTLEPLLRSVPRDVLKATMGEAFAHACLTGQLRTFVKAEVLSGSLVAAPWKTRLQNLARTPECQAAFTRAAAPYFRVARAYCDRFGFRSERALALCMDIAVQNAGGGVREDHAREYARRVLPTDPEWARLKHLAHAVAQSANAQWRADVLARKLSIALGGTEQSKMKVHGRSFDLERDYNLSYDREWA